MKNSILVKDVEDLSQIALKRLRWLRHTQIWTEMFFLIFVENVETAIENKKKGVDENGS